MAKGEGGFRATITLLLQCQAVMSMAIGVPYSPLFKCPYLSPLLFLCSLFLLVHPFLFLFLACFVFLVFLLLFSLPFFMVEHGDNSV